MSKDKPHNKRCNAETLRFKILTELPKYKSFRDIDRGTKDDVIEFILQIIDKTTEGGGDLYT